MAKRLDRTSLPSFRLLLIAAALSFLTAFNHYCIGEEAVFPTTSLEMWQDGVWLKRYLYGGDVQHNPLFNWPIIAFANLFDWTHVLGVRECTAVYFQHSSRIQVCATMATPVMMMTMPIHLSSGTCSCRNNTASTGVTT